MSYISEFIKYLCEILVRVNYFSILIAMTTIDYFVNKFLDRLLNLKRLDSLLVCEFI